MVTAVSVASRRDLKAFIELPYRLHRHNPAFVPPLRIDEWAKFNPKKNPFYQHGRIDPILAKRGHEIVGRIASIDDDNHNRTHGDNTGFFGFFEAVDDEVAETLFTEVEARARASGRAALRGPLNPSMNDGAGFQIDAFESAPFVMMPQNPPAYPEYAEAAGYRKIKDLYAWRFFALEGIGERLARLADRVRKRQQFTVRPADMRNFADELGRLKTVYDGAGEKNWGQVRYTDAEFEHLGSELKLIVDPELVLFLEVDDEVAGVALAIPDINQVFQRFNGRLLPFGIFHLLRRKQIINRARLPILGVLPKFRNRGFELVLIDEIARRGIARGFLEGELSWILEDNDGINKPIRATGAQIYKTYRLYQKPL